MINYKFKAIEDRDFGDGDACFRKGKIYTVKDERLTFECGWSTSVEGTFKAFIDRNKGYEDYIKEIINIDTTKTYKGYEIVKMLYNHELKEGDNITLKSVIYNKKLEVIQCCDTLSLRDKYGSEIANSFLTSPDNTFTIIPYIETVDFLTAWEAYLEGNKISSCTKWSYQNGVMYDDAGTVRTNFMIRKEEFEGKWVIEYDTEA